MSGHTNRRGEAYTDPTRPDCVSSKPQLWSFTGIGCRDSWLLLQHMKSVLCFSAACVLAPCEWRLWQSHYYLGQRVRCSAEPHPSPLIQQMHQGTHHKSVDPFLSDTHTPSHTAVWCWAIWCDSCTLVVPSLFLVQLCSDAAEPPLPPPADQ